MRPLVSYNYQYSITNDQSLINRQVGLWCISTKQHHRLQADNYLRRLWHIHYSPKIANNGLTRNHLLIR